jgi:hypothetical protein
MNTDARTSKNARRSDDSARAPGTEAVNRFIDLASEVMMSGYRSIEMMAAAQLEQGKHLQTRQREAAAEQAKALQSVSEALVEGTQAYFRELADFAKQSTESNLSTVRRFAESADGAEWPSIHAEALAGASSRFVHHATALGGILTDASAKIYEPVRKLAEQNLARVKSASVGQ